MSTCEQLFTSWVLSLRAQRKSPQTVEIYSDGLRGYLAWCTTTGLEAGAAAATARSRQLSVRRFAAWLAEEDEIERDPFLGIKSPRLDERVVEPLTDDELRALVRACAVKKGVEAKVALRYRRDEAIIRLMFETGARAGKVVALAVSDLDLSNGTIVIRRGKGGKGRVVPFGSDAGLAIDRYLRARAGHRLAESDQLWLGDRGKEFSYYGLRKTLADRAQRAGLVGFHPHKLRHAAAHRWLAAGGSESGLMAVAGLRPISERAGHFVVGSPRRSLTAADRLGNIASRRVPRLPRRRSQRTGTWGKGDSCPRVDVRF